MISNMYIREGFLTTLDGRGFTTIFEKKKPKKIHNTSCKSYKNLTMDPRRRIPPPPSAPTPWPLEICREQIVTIQTEWFEGRAEIDTGNPRASGDE